MTHGQPERALISLRGGVLHLPDKLKEVMAKNVTKKVLTLVLADAGGLMARWLKP